MLRHGGADELLALAERLLSVRPQRGLRPMVWRYALADAGHRHDIADAVLLHVDRHPLPGLSDAMRRLAAVDDDEDLGAWYRGWARRVDPR